MIRFRLAEIRPLFILNGALLLIMLAFYRVRVYALISSLYPDLRLTGLPEYLSLTIHQDSLVMAFTLLFVAAVALALSAARRLMHASLALVSMLFIFFILFSIDFFKVYQTTFQSSFAGREHFTGLGNVFDSARAEFSGEFYVLFFLFTLGSAVAHGILCLRAERRVRCQPGPVSGTAYLLVPVPVALLLMVAIATDASVPRDRFEGRYRKDRSMRNMSLLGEVAANPVANLFASRSDGHVDLSTGGPSATGFSFGFNTDSLETDRTHGRIRSIPRGRRYNIILYFFESTPRKYYDIRINGRHVIESWHRLEKNSLNFRNHYANYPLSANALLSVLTSAYELNSKDMLITRHPDVPLLTLSEILKERGYRTCLIHTGGLGYAGQNRFLKNRKFDAIIDYEDLVKSPPYNRQVGWGVDERAMIRPAIDFIGKDPDAPYFMVLLPVNPHHPYACPEDFPRIAGNSAGPGARKTWTQYLNSLHYADASLGKLVDELERAGAMDNTLFFLFADHGEAFYQHKMNYNHPLFLYNENVHVPFLIYNRELFDGPEYFDGITRHIDILPTVIDILGIPRRPEQEGISAVSGRREQFALLHTSWKDDYMGIVDQRWKYIRRTGDGLEELYDLEKDPDERENIAADNPGIVSRYRAVVRRSRAYRDGYYRHVLAQ